MINIEYKEQLLNAAPSYDLNDSFENQAVYLISSYKKLIEIRLKNAKQNIIKRPKILETCVGILDGVDYVAYSDEFNTAIEDLCIVDDNLVTYYDDQETEKEMKERVLSFKSFDFERFLFNIRRLYNKPSKAGYNQENWRVLNSVKSDITKIDNVVKTILIDWVKYND